ncbi:condensation domain-containing protein [Massilia sp. B-10]|nr:condensation domain-containing protein [Massilia sp. B-10]
MAREDAPGDQRLVAYLLTNDGAELDVAALRSQLSVHLSDYMVPNAFVALAAWPLTPNGKLDRKALPVPGQDAVATGEYEAPEGDVETALAAIWQELLGLDRISRHDHFFKLGGHSLLAVRLVARVRQRFGAELAVRDLFAQPTLAAVAALVARSRSGAADAMVAVDRSAALPLSWAQQRLWFLDQLDAAAGCRVSHPGGLPPGRFARYGGPAGRHGPDRRAPRIAAHQLCRRWRRRPGPALCRAGLRFLPALKHDLRALSGAERDSAVLQICADEMAARFDLAQGPLIRGQLLRVTDDEHILLVTQHHIISDGWSLGVLMDEVQALYNAFSQGQPDPLAPLALQYADYAAWQRNWLQGEVLDQQVAFWKSHLLGAPALLSLPTDRARPGKQSFASGALALSLPSELSA